MSTDHVIAKSNPPLVIRRRKDLTLTSFKGIEETPMLVRPPLSHPQAMGASNGFAGFNYLADGRIEPHGGMPIHGHSNTDIVSVVLQGSIDHKGTLGDGLEVSAPGVIVQRAGTGMQHAEMNALNEVSSFIQMWFSPPAMGLRPDFRLYQPSEGEMTLVLGGADGSDTFASPMQCSVGLLLPGQKVFASDVFALYLVTGTIIANGTRLDEPCLIEGESLSLSALCAATVILVTVNHQS